MLKISKKFPILMIFGAAVLFNLSANAAQDIKSSKDWSFHFRDTARHVLTKFGVFSDNYVNFFTSLLQDKGTKQGSAYYCVKALRDNSHSRSRMLDCLSRHKKSGFDVNLFKYLSQAKWNRIHKASKDLHVNKSIALLAYLEDVTREIMEKKGTNTAWWIKDKGFWQQGNNQGDFQYEDGDIVLMIGNSSISSLISQVTVPRRRYSHAMMVRVRDGKFMSLEAIIEKGVTSKPKKKFSQDNLQSVVVLRWKDKSKRKQIAAKASDCGQKLYKNDTEYNFSMDMNDTSKMFCSQLVAHCYAQASGKRWQNMIPVTSHIKSDRVLDYLSNMGVTTKDMPSPGDLAASDEFEMVAEYRRVRDEDGNLAIHRLWDMFFMGDIFVDRLEKGQKVYFSKLTNFFTHPIMNLTNLFLRTTGGSIFGPDLMILGGIFPEGIDAQVAGHMIVQEKYVFGPVWKRYGKSLKKFEHPQDKGNRFDPNSLISTHPVYRRTQMSLELNSVDYLIKNFR